MWHRPSYCWSLCLGIAQGTMHRSASKLSVFWFRYTKCKNLCYVQFSKERSTCGQTSFSTSVHVLSYEVHTHSTSCLLDPGLLLGMLGDTYCTQWLDRCCFNSRASSVVQCVWGQRHVTGERTPSTVRGFPYREKISLTHDTRNCKGIPKQCRVNHLIRLTVSQPLLFFFFDIQISVRPCKVQQEGEF